MAISVTDVWRNGVQRRNPRLRYLSIIDDGTTQWKSLSGSCDQFSYQIGLAGAPSSVAAELDPITREVSIGELVVQFRDKYLRPILVNNRLKGQFLTIKIGSADIPENDFCFYASGIIDKITGDGKSNVITVSCLDAFSVLRDTKISGSWIDKHPIEILYYGDGSGMLEKAGVPSSLINTTTFDPDLYSDSISHWNTCKISWYPDGKPIYVYEATSAWQLVSEVLFVLSGTIVIDEEGQLAFTRFDSTTTPVCTWSKRHIKRITHLESDIDIINRFILEFFGDRYNDGAIEFEHNDTDSQSDFSFKGSGSAIYAQKKSTKWINAWGILGDMGGITDSSTSMTVQSYFTACFTGMRESNAGPQPANNTVSGDRPAYFMIRNNSYDDNAGDEIVKVTSITPVESLVSYFYDGDWRRKYGPFYNKMTVNTMERGQYGTGAYAWSWFCAIIDITQVVAIAENIIKRWAYGGDIIEISTPMSEFDKQLGDLVYVEDADFVAYDKDGLDGTDAFEIIKKEPRPEDNEIVWVLATAGIITPTSSYDQRQAGGWTSYDQVMQAAAQGDVLIPVVLSGMEFSIDAGFDGDFSAGILSFNGRRINIPNDSFTFTASKDTYVTYNLFSNDWALHETSNGGATPSKADLEIWIAKVVTDGAGITGSTDLRSTIPIRGTSLEAGTGVLAHLNASGELDTLQSVTTRSLDDITDGVTYERVLGASLSAGKLNLSAGAGGIAGSLPGSSLTAGSGCLSHLNGSGELDTLQSVTTRSLDDITDGVTYERVLGAALSAGKLNLSAGAGGIVNYLPGSSLAAGTGPLTNINGSGVLQPGGLADGVLNSPTQIVAGTIAPQQMAREASPSSVLNPNPGFRFRSRG